MTGEHEDRVILRLLADRYHQLTAQRTRSVCRLHAVLCLLIEGGTGRSLNVHRARKLLASVRDLRSDHLRAGRVLQDFVAEIATLDDALADTEDRAPSPRCWHRRPPS